VNAARALMPPVAANEKRIQATGKVSGSTERLHRALRVQPLFSIATARFPFQLFPSQAVALHRRRPALDFLLSP
jgi:hypothetical protein